MTSRLTVVDVDMLSNDPCADTQKWYQRDGTPVHEPMSCESDLNTTTIYKATIKRNVVNPKFAMEPMSIYMGPHIAPRI